MKEEERLTQPSIEQSTQIRIPENEVLIVFQDDWEAIAFNEWWHQMGENLFEEYAKENYKENIEFWQ